MDLRELYQDIILDHGRHPRNFGALETASHVGHGHNPLCGDRLTVFLRLENNRVAEARFEGKGCAISTASASLMTEIVQGRSIEDVNALFEDFHHHVTGRPRAMLCESLADAAERLEPLTGVKAYPTRVKCATLAWHTIAAAFDGGAASVAKTE